MTLASSTGAVPTALAGHASTGARPEDSEHHRQPTPHADAPAEALGRDPEDAATLAQGVLTAIARLLGRQAAREWLQTQGAEHGA
jgi:hypothetical protein